MVDGTPEPKVVIRVRDQGRWLGEGCLEITCIWKVRERKENQESSSLA